MFLFFLAAMIVCSHIVKLERSQSRTKTDLVSVPTTGSTPHSADLDVSSSTAAPLPPGWRRLSSVNIRITMHRWWRSGQSYNLTSSEVSWCSCKATAWTMTGGLELLTWEEKAIGIGQAVLLQLGTLSGKKTNLMLVFIGTVCCQIIVLLMNSLAMILDALTIPDISYARRGEFVSKRRTLQFHLLLNMTRLWNEIHISNCSSYW